MASFLQNNPTNRDFLSQINFRMLLKRAPNVSYFVQKFNVPGKQIDGIQQPNPLGQIWKPGNRVYYNELVVQFKVNETLDNYLEIADWIDGLGHPFDLDQYAALAKNPEWTGEGLESTITLMILNASRQANIEVVFDWCWPFFLSDLEFDSTGTEVDFLPATVKFYFSGPYKISVVNAPVEITTPTKVEV